MKDEAWLFVYGTLQPGMSNYGVIEAWVREAVRGRIRGCLVDAAAGQYPALVMDKSSRTASKSVFPAASASGSIAESDAVFGWWLRIGIRGLAETDRLEEYCGPEESNDYERIWTADLDAPSRQGWVYVWPTSRGCPAIGSSKWPPSPD
ncbi:gamma-glutamylcyclotransferase [Paenibacillus sp. D51F]